MKTPSYNHCRRPEAGYALLLVLAFTGAALLLATGVFQYAHTTTTLNNRHNEHQRAVAAAEAATEKVIAQLTTDYRDLGQGYVLSHLNSYRTTVPTAAEFADSGDFVFHDLSKQEGRVDITYIPGTTFEMSSGKYTGLRGINNRLRVVSNARAVYAESGPVGSVFQDIELIRIPLFQFAIFYNMDLEFDNLPVMTITGPVHCNTNIYLDPYNTLTFNSDVTSSGTIYATKMAINPLSGGSGAIVYKAAHDSKVPTLNLPIGTNTSSEAVRAVIEVPPSLEDPYSSIGQERYYNKAELIILVQDTNIVATSGLKNSFSTVIPATQITNFLFTNITFHNKRELKDVKASQLDVARFSKWKETNTYFNSLLAGQNIKTIYLADQRTQSGTQSGVKLVNGEVLPDGGLTVATPNPLYVQGHYNAPAAHRGSTNTSATMPASVVADAVTILSAGWSDSLGIQPLALRLAVDTTVNAAILTGQVPTTTKSYSGGVENFPRFLEEWTGKTLTYNGSMVAMFNSKIATNAWRGIGATHDIYNPPNRNWALDQNFLVENRLPPASPSVTMLVRGRWRMPAPYSTNVLAGF
jgi:hypothetical protein